MDPTLIAAAVSLIGGLANSKAAGPMPLPASPISVVGGNASTVNGDGNTVDQTGGTPYVNTGYDPLAGYRQATGSTAGQQDQVAGIPTGAFLLLGFAAVLLMRK
jgi:hypothetical protein